MKYLLLTALLLLFTNLQAQCDTSRYTTTIFDSVIKHANIQYGTGQVWNIPYNNTDLFMDIYEPHGDTQTKRPLMIWIHPGGYLLGDKEADDMVALCDSFARKGYVTASISYRLGFNPLSASSAVRAVYRGTQDARAAVRYLKEFATTYSIDTNFTFMGGSSAGAFSTLHTAYLTDAEAPPEIQAGLGYPALGCLDCSGNTYQHNIDLTGIISLWGALGDVYYIQAFENVPALLIHGDADATVPILEGYPFGFTTTPYVYGSQKIHGQLTSLNIPHTFLPFAGLGHEFHGADNGMFTAPPNNYWDTILDAVQNHVYPLLLPDEGVILGDTLVCGLDTNFYSTILNSEETACWSVTGGTILNDYGDSIEIKWNTFGNQTITLTKYNSIHAATKSYFTVMIGEIPNAGFTSSTSFITGVFMSNNTIPASYFWNFGDSTTSIFQNPIHTYSVFGQLQITLTVTSIEGCVSSSQNTIYIPDPTISLNELGQNSFKFYPNPAMKNLTIEAPIDTKISIYDVLGRLLISETVSDLNSSIDVSKLIDGSYQIQFEHGSEFYSSHFIKK